VVLTWYQASAVCSGSTCAATPSGALPAGPYAWFLLPKNASGEGDWSSAMSFQVQTLPAPQQVGPAGLSATNQPTYRWVPVAGATGYSLWVDDATPAPIIRQSYSTSVCTATECAVTPNITLGPGTHTWYVLTQSESGDGPLSPGMSFVTPSWSGGTSCEGAFRAADFNADGRTDRLCSQFGVTTVQLSTGSGFAGPAAWLDQEVGEPLIGDFDGDGSADIAAYDGTSKAFKVALSMGTQFAPLSVWGTATATWTDGQTYSCGGVARTGTGNFDANGYADVWCRGASDGRVFVGRSTGSSFTISIFADTMCGVGGERIGPADFDGDGRDDWYCIDNLGGLYGRLSSGDAFEDNTFQGPGRGPCEKDDWSFADFNGDARTDVACRPNGFVGLSTGAAILDTQSTGEWCNDEKTLPGAAHAGPAHPRPAEQRRRPGPPADTDLLSPADRAEPAPPGPREGGANHGLRPFGRRQQDDVGHVPLRHPRQCHPAGVSWAGDGHRRGDPERRAAGGHHVLGSRRGALPRQPPAHHAAERTTGSRAHPGEVGRDRLQRRGRPQERQDLRAPRNHRPRTEDGVHLLREPLAGHERTRGADDDHLRRRRPAPGDGHQLRWRGHDHVARRVRTPPDGHQPQRHHHHGVRRDVPADAHRRPL
jgi:hypothetical protein